VGVHLDSEVRPLDQIAVTLGGSSQLTPPAPATLEFPVRFAVELPLGTTQAHLDFAGLRGGSELAHAAADTAPGADLSLTLKASSPGDLSLPSDLAELGGRDLSAGDLLSAVYMLTVQYRGTGSGTLMVDGLPCAKPSCSFSRLNGSIVSIVASADPGSTLVALTGACTSTTGGCTFTMTGPSTVTANFKNPSLVKLTVVPVPLSAPASVLTVTPSPGPLQSCGTNCYLYSAGSTTTLVPAISGGTFLGWGGAACKFNQPCPVVLTNDIGVTAAWSDTPMNYAFVTSTTHAPSELSSGGSPQAYADGICQARATTAGLPDAGSFKAWLSTVASPAPTHIAGRGWVRTDGLPFADDVASITGAGRPRYPLALDENGNFVPGGAWTGTGIDGQPAANCSDWTNGAAMGQIGTAYDGSDGWTASSTLGCLNAAALYCFGTAQSHALSLGAPAGARLAFVTQQKLNGAASLDGLCQSEAQASGLGGSFRAYLTGSTRGGLIAFDQTAGPWMRLDHVLLAPSTSRTILDAQDAQRLAPLGQRASSVYSDQLEQGWLGDASNNCQDWSSVGVNGAVLRTGLLRVPPSTQSCGSNASVFCLQE
jgi:hypothetical protein